MSFSSSLQRQDLVTSYSLLLKLFKLAAQDLKSTGSFTDDVFFQSPVTDICTRQVDKGIPDQL